MENGKIPFIVYALYAVGWIAVGLSAIEAIAALSLFAATVEGPSLMDWAKVGACAMSGLLLLALAMAIDLLRRIFVSAEAVANACRDQLHIAQLILDAVRTHPGPSNSKP